MSSLSPGEAGPRRSAQHQSQGDSYEPPTAINMAAALEMTQPEIESSHSTDTASTYNSVGHYDGPYYVQYREDGSRVQKRWCKCLSQSRWMRWMSVVDCRQTSHQLSRNPLSHY